MNQNFLDLLEKSKAIHLKKSQDYTTNPNENPHENFERANIIASWFPDEYKSFAVLIGTKLARLAALLSSGRAPNNESIDDTFLDQLTYTGLMYAFYKDRIKPVTESVLGPGEIISSHISDCWHNFIFDDGQCLNCPRIFAPQTIAMKYKPHQNKPGIFYRKV